MNEIVVKSWAYGGLFFCIHLITSRHNPMFWQSFNKSLWSKCRKFQAKAYSREGSRGAWRANSPVRLLPIKSFSFTAYFLGGQPCLSPHRSSFVALETKLAFSHYLKSRREHVELHLFSCEIKQRHKVLCLCWGLLVLVCLFYDLISSKIHTKKLL